MKDDEKPPALELLRSPDAEQLLAYLAENGEHKAYEALKRYFPNSFHLERIKGPTYEEYRAAKDDYLEHPKYFHPNTGRPLQEPYLSSEDAPCPGAIVTFDGKKV